MQWSWGLETEHDRGAYPRTDDPRMQQATVNLFADMGVQPQTLEAGRVAASESTDHTPPVATIETPANGSQVESGEEMTIEGSATDVGGQVAGVEVSLDGGETWTPAEGRGSWKYKWTPGATGTVQIVARATDDSANLEEPGDESTVEVVPRSCPCTIWDNTFSGEPESDPSQIEVGVKFRADVSGYITGLRYYKTSEATGAHVGHLYTASGTQLAEVTFSKETASGWQQVSLPSPVAISANTTYIASYYAPNGHYAALSGYFSVVGADAAPLHAPASGVVGGNGVYHYGGNGSLFSEGGPESYNGTNYMADVVFEAEQQPPVISNVQAAAHNDGTATVTWQTDKASDSKVDYGTSSSSLSSSVSDSSAVTSHSVQLTGLNPNATYYFRVTSSSGSGSRTEPSLLLSPLSFVTPPAAPSLTATIPASPANANSPKVVGSAAPGSTVKLYSTSGCSGSPLATAGAAELAAGVTVSVADNSSTTFRATATGAASEASACSAGLTYVEDSSPPQTQISSGPPALSASAKATFAFSGSDTGGSGVASYQCRIDSSQEAAWGTCTSPKEYSGLADGAHSFEVRAVDKAGNVDASPAVATWTVDTSAPDTQISSQPPALSSSAKATFAFSGNDGSGSGVTGYQCRIDSTQEAAWGACSSPKEYTGLADGAHSFEVRAIDKAGNVDASPAAFSWTVDTTAPQVQIESKPPSLSASSSATLSFSGSDSGSGVASYQCRRDSEAVGAWEACTSPETYNALAEGSHTFEVRAIDGAGNVTQSPASYTWTIDTTAPQTQIDSAPKALTTATAAELEFSATDAGGSGVNGYQCRLDSTQEAAWGSCSSPKEYSGLVDGAHSFEVRAVDKAGNIDATPAVSTWTVDTTAPDTQISANPPALSSSAKATFAFGGNDGSGSGVASYQCRLDSSEAKDWAACSSSKTYEGLADGAHSFEVRAIDQAGNVDQSPATFTWTIDATAPTTQIDSAPAPLVATGTAGFAFSGNDGSGSGVASYQCRIDSTQEADWGSCSSPKEYTGLTDGAHSFEVRAIDKAGNTDASPAVSTWTVDTTAPDTQISSQPPSLSASANAEFAFSGNDGSGSGVNGYQCRLDSTQEADWGSCSSPKEYTGLADGSHTFEVRANDKVGNADASPAAFSWTVDTTAPQTQIDSAPKALTTATAAELEFSATDAGGSGVNGYQCRLDSTQEAAWGSCASPKEYSNLADGSHSFEVRAIDKAGNADASPAVSTWTVDTTAPDTQISSQPPSLSASANAEFAFSGNDGSGSGVASYQCRLDSTQEAAWGSCSSPKQYTGLSDGSHSFEVRAIDKAGNVDQSPAAFSWTIDATAPQTQIESGPSSLTTSTTAGFVFSGNDGSGSGVASYQCRFDSTEAKDWAPCSSPKEYAGLADGQHTLEVRAIDKAGNADQSPATHTWRIDTTAPETQVDSGPAALSASANAEFAFSGTDAGGSGVASYECRRDSSEAKDWVPCSSPQTYPALADGAHSFEVRAIDKAGNVDQSPAVFSWTIDATAPQTQIGSHPNALSASASASFAFSGEDGSGSGVTSYQCRIDSTQEAAWGNCASPKQYTGLSDGSHSFEVRAIDKAGNADQSPASFTWTVDATAPTTQIDSGPSSLVATAKAEFAFSGSDGSGSGVASYECRIDSTQQADWHACSSPKVYEGLSDGSHSFEVRAVDQAGNADATPAVSTWTVDTTAPATQIDAHPGALSASAAAQLEFSGSDTGGSGVASYECRIDSTQQADWHACSSPKVYEGLSDGSHSFEVRAVDQAGNADATPATSTWTVDTTAPDTQISSNPPALSSSAKATFAFSGNDGSGSGVASYQCRLDSSEAKDWASCASPKEYSGLADGSHTFEVRAIDQAGNTDGSPAVSTWMVDTSAPQTQIDSGPSSLVATAKAEFAFSGNDGSGSGVASYECRIDSTQSADWHACSSPKVYEGLSDGSHSFEVRAVDQAGNADATPAVSTWTVDTTAPATQIGSQPPSLSASAAAQFEFSGSDAGGSGVASYECRLDSSQEAAWGSCASPKEYSGLADGSHSFEVRAIDKAGNADASAASFTWTVDATAPATQIDSGPSSLVATAKAEFAFSGNDAGGSGVASYECRIDSTQSADWHACSSPKVYEGLSDGSHSFEVRAVDQAGNADASPAVSTWTVDTTAPTTQIGSQPPSLSASAAAQLEFSGSDTGGSGVAGFECRLDSSQEAAWGSCSSPKEYASLADGAHTFEVRAIDKAGNVDATPAVSTWTVDTTAPDTQIGSHPSQLSASAQAEFAFSGNDGSGSGVASLECRLDSNQEADWHACSSPKEYSGLADGAHTFEVRAVDQAGNADATPASFLWTIDTTAPQTQVDSGPAALTTATAAEFEFSASDGSGSGVASYQCRLDSSQPGDWSACASPKEYASLADGSHSFEVRATDQAGNVDASPATYSWTVDTSAPQTQIDSGPSSLVATAKVTFAFSGNDGSGSGVAAYECRLDSSQEADWHSCASPKEYASLADGAHTFEVRAVDKAGNADPTPAVSTWTVDTTASDTQIDSKPPSLSPSAKAEFAFSGNDGSGSGVASYECRLDSTQEADWGSCSSPMTYEGLGDGSHTLEVRSTDQAGNTDPSPASYAWTIDTTAPNTQISSGPASLTSETAAEFAFGGSDAGGSGVAAYECRIDSTQSADWHACSSPKQYTGLADGSHSFEVRAIDKAGNADASAASFTWTVDATAPTTQIDSGPSSLVATAKAEFAFSGNDGSGSGVASYECRLDSNQEADWHPCSSPREYSALADGSHSFEVRAVDQAGNADATPATSTWTVDTTAPQTQISSSPPSLSSSAKAEFAFAGNDGSGSGVASLECRLDSTQQADWHACSSPKAYEGLSDGSHSFEARAIDQAGNADGSPAAYSWTIDTTPPVVAIDSLSKALVGAGQSSEVHWHSNENGSFELRVGGSNCSSGTQVASGSYSGAPAQHTSAVAATDLAEGANTLRVCVIDAASNRGSTTASIEKDATAPDTQIDSHPAGLSNSAAAQFAFSGTDGSGSGVASYECRRDSTEPGAWSPCASPQSYASLPDGAHTFQVRATDAAANTDASPATFNWTIDTTAPTATIDAGPGGLTNDATPTFEFHSSEAGSSFECSIDTGTPSWAPCTDPGADTPPSALADGSYSFRVRATDQAANTGAAATRAFSVDTAAPPAPSLESTQPPSPANNNSPKLIGSAPAGSTVRLYEGADCSGSPIATVSAASLEAGVTLSVPDDSTTALRAGATSAAGNLSGCSAPLTYTEDSTAPTTQIDTHPASLSGSAAAQLSFSGTDSGGSGVASFECRLDSSQAGDWQACSSPKQYTALAEGSHSFEVRAVDKAANTDATPASFTWSVDTTAPQTQIDSHPAALTASAAAQLSFSGTDTGGSGVASYQCRIDSSEASAWSACASPKQYSSLADGSHTFEVRAIDAAGNADGSPASFTWTVDTTAPDTQIDSHPAGLSNSAAAQFAFSGTDGSGSGVASYECRRDSTEASAWSPCASPQSYASLPDGAHTFQVRAIDAAGNTDASPATFNWTIDTTAPTATIDAGPGGLTNDATPTFEFHSSEAGSSFECSIDTGTPSWAPCTDPGADTPPSALADGSYSFRVRATDQAANTGAAATRAFSVDTAAPPAPSLESTQPPSPANDNSPKLIGSAPAGSTVRLYEGADCSGSPIATVSAASLEAGVTLSVPDDSTTALRAGATSAAGNLSGCSAPLTYTEDSTAPTTQIDTHPASLSGSAAAQLSFSGTDSGGSGVASFECRLDSSQAGDWQACSSPKQYTALAEGSHSFEVRAVDKAANTDATPATFTWSVDTTAPQTQIDSHPAALTASAAAQLSFSGTDTGGSGVASYQCRIDSSEASAWSACASPKTYSSLADGSHTFEVRAIDAAGNADGSPASFTWTVDTTAPDTQIDSHPAGLSNSAAAQFAFSGTDGSGSGVASYECRRDSTEPGAWSPCASPQSYASLPDGAHTFQVRATDAAANTDASPATFNWTIDTTAPTATIDAGPSGLTNDATPTFEFHSSEAGSSFECSIDTGTPSWAPCTDPGADTPPSALADGSYSFRVRATDQAANTGAAATRAFSVDTAAPPAPSLESTQPPSPANDNSPKLIGSAPAGSTVRLYEGADCSGSPIATVSAASLEAGVTLSVPDDSTTALRAGATSAAGNLSGCSAPLTYTEDSTAPTTQIDTHPASLSGSAAAQLSFSGTDSGGSGVASYECRLDSSQAGDWQACSSPKQYSGLAEGSHSFEVRAVDKAANTDATPASFTWSVDTTAPQTQIDSHPAALTASASAQLSFSGTDTGGSGVASYQCRIDSSEASAWSACASPKQYSSLADGSHTFEVRAIDAAGNADGSPASFTWTVDTTAPDTQIDSHPAGLSNSAAAQFAFSGTDGSGSGVASYECRRDSTEASAWSPCASPQSYASLPDGAHTFQVRAIDAAGNTDASPATFNWTIDTTAPTATIDAGPGGLTNDATPTFEFHSSEAGSSFECSIDTGTPSWAPCTDPGADTPPSPLADGSYSFRVRATDQAANTGAAATRAFSVDTAAPPAPSLESTQPPSPANDNSPKLIGSAPAGSTVRLYEGADCSGSPIATVSAASLEAGVTLSVPDDSTTALRAGATSAAGNLSGCSAPLTYTEDSTAPTTQIDTHPASLSGSAAAQLSFSGTDSGGSGVASFECRLDSSQAGDWQACSSPKQYTALAEGSHSFEVRAVDKAANTDATPATFTWSVDTTAPQTQIDSHPAALTASAAAQLSFSGTDTGGSGVASYQCRIDSSEASAWSACASPKTYSSLADGSHTFEVRAIDAAGNADGSPASFTWTVDTTAPDTQIDSHPAGLSNSAAAQFAFSGTDGSGSGVASYECRRDSTEPGAWSPCASPQSYASLPDGAHTFQVRATDAAANTDASPATFNWTIDTTAPTATIDAGPSGLTNDATPTFEFHSSEAGSSFECSIDTGTPSWAPCTDPGADTPPSPLADGSYTFRVRATDQAANTGAPATRAFEVEANIPSAPVLTATSPASPANNNSPKIAGSAPAGTTVRLYANADCSGAPVAVVEPDELAAGVPVTVPDNSTTSFSATATSVAEITSSCSAPITYIEDSTEPAPESSNPSESPPSTLALRTPVRLLRIEYDLRHGSARLLFDVPAPGSLSVTTPTPSARESRRGRATRKAILWRRSHQIRSTTVHVAHAGKVTVPVRLSSAGRRLLLEDGRVKVRARISYTANGEATVSRMIAITLKRRDLNQAGRPAHNRRGRPKSRG